MRRTTTGRRCERQNASGLLPRPANSPSNSSCCLGPKIRRRTPSPCSGVGWRRAARPVPAEIRQIIEKVRYFLEAHGGSQFEDWDAPLVHPVTLLPFDQRVSNRAGYRRGKGAKQRWLILPQVWREEVCQGFNPTEVARILHGLGMLESGENGELRVNNVSQTIKERNVSMYFHRRSSKVGKIGKLWFHKSFVNQKGWV